jgi:hypothetical protein
MKEEEAYLVKLDYRKPDGYWVCSHEEEFYPVVSKPKCNHEKAEKLAKEKYPGCKIITVTYI